MHLETLGLPAYFPFHPYNTYSNRIFVNQQENYTDVKVANVLFIIASKLTLKKGCSRFCTDLREITLLDFTSYSLLAGRGILGAVIQELLSQGMTML